MSENLQPTLKDIAREVGVSAVTVSLALRNHPRIPLARSELIQKTTRRLGYRPDPMATALINRRWQVQAHPVSAELAWLNHWREPQ